MNPEDDYLEFRRRALRRMAELASLDCVDGDGLVGAVAKGLSPRGGLVLVDRRARGVVTELLREHTPAWIGLMPKAACLREEVSAAGWDLAEDHRMMSLPDLQALKEMSPPSGIEIQEVAVRGGQEGYPLVAALRVQLEHSHGDEAAPVRDLELEARMLRTLSEVRLFAALSAEGCCVGTAGSRVVDTSALVAGVVTIPSARRQGLATAMTCHALRAARAGGANNAFLDATAAGAGIYARLGFRDLGLIAYHERSEPRRSTA